jgi:hypothetical protein
MESLPPTPPPPKRKFNYWYFLLGLFFMFVLKTCVDYITNPGKHSSGPSYNTVSKTAQQIKDDSELYYYDLQLEVIDKYSMLDSSIVDSSRMYTLKNQIVTSTPERRTFLDSFYRAFYLFHIFYLRDYLECGIEYSQGRKDAVCNWGDSTEKYYSKLYYQFSYTYIKRYQREYNGFIDYYRSHPESVTLSKKKAESLKVGLLISEGLAFSRNYEFLFGKKLF